MPLRCPDLHIAADSNDLEPLFVTLVDNLNNLGRHCTQALQLMRGEHVCHLEEAVWWHLYRPRRPAECLSTSVRAREIDSWRRLFMLPRDCWLRAGLEVVSSRLGNSTVVGGIARPTADAGVAGDSDRASVGPVSGSPHQQSQWQCVAWPVLILAWMVLHRQGVVATSDE